MKKKTITGWMSGLLGAVLLSMAGSGCGMESGAEIEFALDDIIIGPPVAYRNLTIYPLLTRNRHTAADYLTLDQAMERGVITVAEKSGGSVHEVLITNRSSLPVFIFAGEIIAGARQDRIVRQDTLLAPCGGKMTVSVYCVERGRWQGAGNTFTPSYCNAGATLRKIAQLGVSQAEVWEAVEIKNREQGVAPPTGTLRAVYTSDENKTLFGDYEKRFGCLPEMGRGTVGVVVCSGEKIICGDLFAGPALFRAEWKKLLKSYITDVTGAPGYGGRVDRWRVEDFLARFRSPGSVERTRGISLGDNIKLSCSGGVGAGLLYRGRLVHISLFAAEGIEKCHYTGRVLGSGERRNLR